MFSFLEYFSNLRFAAAIIPFLFLIGYKLIDIAKNKLLYLDVYLIKS